MNMNANQNFDITKVKLISSIPNDADSSLKILGVNLDQNLLSQNT